MADFSAQKPVTSLGSTPGDADSIPASQHVTSLGSTPGRADTVVGSEQVGFAEAVSTRADYQVVVSEAMVLTGSILEFNFVVVEETLTFVERLNTGATIVEALDASTVSVTFPQEIRFEGVDLRNFQLRPASAGAIPARLVSVEPVYDVTATGSYLYTLPVEYAFDGSSAARGSLDVGFSNLLDFSRTAVFDAFSVNDYIELLNSEAAGRYRIVDVGLADFFFDIGEAPFIRVYLDRPLPLKLVENGYVEGAPVITPVSSGVVRFTMTNAQLSASNPLVGVLQVWNRTTGQVVDAGVFYPAPSTLVMVNYNTFEIHVNPAAFNASPGDRVYVLARTAPRLQWRHTSAVKQVLLHTNHSPGTKLTLGQNYDLSGRNLLTKAGAAYGFEDIFTVTLGPTAAQRPKVLQATFQIADGTVIVQFDQEMLIDDGNLGNPADYTITGPSTVKVKRVYMASLDSVALVTSGLHAGDYTLTVSTSTPKDVAGNPIDPTYNAVIFTAALPETVRSIFTDHGPISKPPLTLQSGVNASFQKYNEVTLPGASLSASTHIGLYVKLSGGALNGGSFRISGVLSATRARLANASFTLPDPNSGSLTWELYDARQGQIADDPSDVTVRINGTPVTPEAVVGLLGQIILSVTPGPTDDVKVDYSWVCNPTVDVRRYNSREFRYNSGGFSNDGSQHYYRYNNVLVSPDDYDAEVLAAPLPAPLERDLKYRAYERAYTPVYNDPTLLLNNSPTHHIAYPPEQRSLIEQFVTYEGLGLPEVQGWTKRGNGTVVSSLGHLLVTDTTSGPYPTGQPLFWTRPIDVTFDHVFALSWRMFITSHTPNGIFTGVAAGYSDDKVALVVGFLMDGSTMKFGVLKRGSGDDPSTLAAWTGGVDSSDNPTGVPGELDWSVNRSYRVFRDRGGTIQVFVDGEVTPRLRVTPDELPLLEELQGPFDQVQGVFFGSLSREAQNSSNWDFVRYLIQPTNPTQVSSASFVSYEANVVPEQDSKPWTPVGFHGTETIVSSDVLLLDSTSATDDATAAAVGLVDGDFRGFVRFEPLLTQASEIVVDAQVQLLTYTNGVSPNGLTFAVDDGSRLMQVAFCAFQTDLGQDFARVSYGGRSLPEDFAPFAWQTLGAASAGMIGRTLRISDSSNSDGRIYYYDDSAPITAISRVTTSFYDYIIEFRCRVESFTVDGVGYAGAFVQNYDSSRLIGALFEVVSGIRYVAFHSDGVTLGSSARFAFNWGDGNFHTYRLVKNTGGDLVSLFVDGNFLGSLAYSSFAAPVSDPVGQLSFGSSTPSSSQALSVVDWAYVNAWRLGSSVQHYVGLWKGTHPKSLLGYHLPLKVSGKGATVAGNGLGDTTVDFISAGVASGDRLIVDEGPNQGVYTIDGVGSSTTLTISGGVWPAQPSAVDYRIVKQTDWSTTHRYRLARDGMGDVSLFLDSDAEPLIAISYNSIDLPESGAGIIKTLADGLPTIAFGSFDSTQLAQSKWDFVRYAISTSPTEDRIAPHHQVQNQWNVMESPERLFTNLPHTLTSFQSSSTGIVPKDDPDLLQNPALNAWTVLNQDTPLVPQTQTYEVRTPYPVEEFVSSYNNPEDVYNSDGDFTMNDGSIRFRLVVPDDILYTSLDVIERSTGEDDLLAPFDDDDPPVITGVTYTKEVCLSYEATTLPENDSTATTPWELVSDDPSDITTVVAAGVLTYGTGIFGSRTVYRNNTPLPDHPSLTSEIKFRLKVVNDGVGGIGETDIKFGFSAPGMTAALTFITTPLGERYVLVVDEANNGAILGAATLDFLDGNFHTYRLVRDPCRAVVEVFIDS